MDGAFTGSLTQVRGYPSNEYESVPKTRVSLSRGPPAEGAVDTQPGYRKNGNAVLRTKELDARAAILGYERFGPSRAGASVQRTLRREWSRYQNHFRLTFKLEKREKKEGEDPEDYEKKPQTPINGGWPVKRSLSRPRRACVW